MQLLATAEMMKQCDRTAIMRFSIPGIVLMENAGRAFVDVMEKRVGSLAGKHVIILCGKGNNGGDGFVIGRHCSNRGALVHIILLARRREVKGDAKTNMDIVLKMCSAQKSSQRSGMTFTEVLSKKKLAMLSRMIVAPESCIVVDAIFGTGFQGEVKGLYKDVIAWVNQQQAFVASVDIPSGVDATTGVVENIAVKANLTGTMGLAKVGHFVGAGRDHSGEVEVLDISIPRSVLHRSSSPISRVEAIDVRQLLPQRPKDAHKYSVGTVLVISGSRNFTGAPVMTALSAMKAGAGAVILAAPKSIHAVLARKVTEVMLLPLVETSDGTIALSAESQLEKRIHWADVVALGPGLSQHDETRELIHRLVRSINKPVVLDADALGMVARDTSILKRRKWGTIITPHVGEFRLLSKLDSELIERQRVAVTRSQAKTLNSVLVLKGSPTTTGTPEGRVYLNSSGNPGMATAGSGDVLTGIVASLVAQGLPLVQAAYAGVFIHGLAGDMASKRFGERSMMAMDLLQCIPQALQEIAHV